MTDWSPNCTSTTLRASLLVLSILIYLAWATKPIKQDVLYEDMQGVEDVLGKLRTLPPLVTTQEV